MGEVGTRNFKGHIKTVKIKKKHVGKIIIKKKQINKQICLQLLDVTKMKIKLQKYIRLQNRIARSFKG